MSKDFETLVRTHQAAVCATAYCVLRDRARAEEVAQDAFLVAWQKLPALPERPPLPGWICGIARNLARNAARKKREVAVLDDRDDVATGSEGPLDSLLSAEARTVAERALAALPEQDREAITLYYMGEGEHADIARALGVTEANARQRVHRARAKLRDAASAVENVLRAARPGPAFTAACVAALAAGKAVDAKAATTAKASGLAKTLAIVAGAIAVVGGAIFVATSRAPSLEPRTTPAQVAPPLTDRDVGSASRVAIDRAAVLHRISPAVRADMAARLRGSSGGSASTTPVFAEPPTKVYDFSGGPLEGGTPIDPPPPDASPKRVLRYAIQELQPLLAECHKGLSSSGTLAMRVVLLGGPGVGTIVESVEIDPEGSDATFEPSFTECMEETLYAIELPPMPTLDRWDVHYPFSVTPSLISP